VNVAANDCEVTTVLILRVNIRAKNGYQY